jgi:hypothetical protein
MYWQTSLLQFHTKSLFKTDKIHDFVFKSLLSSFDSCKRINFLTISKHAGTCVHMSVAQIFHSCIQQVQRVE